MRQGQITQLDSSGLATLAADLTSLVGRLEADWEEQRILRPETAAELRNLRKRAEHLLCT